MYRKTQNKRELGRFRHNVEVSLEYARFAREDEQTGLLLRNAGKYRQSMYFTLQAMEKYVRAKVFSMLDAKNPYFRQEHRDHALKEAVEALIKVFSGDERLRNQVIQQINDYVLGDTKYEYLHNDLRYPKYSPKFNSYSCLDVTETDCELLLNKLDSLKKYLDGLDRLR